VLCLIISGIKSIAALGSKKFWLMTFKITLRLEKKKHWTKSKMFLVFGKMFAIWNLKEFLMGAKLWISRFWQMMKSKMWKLTVLTNWIIWYFGAWVLPWTFNIVWRFALWRWEMVRPENSFRGWEIQFIFSRCSRNWSLHRTVSQYWRQRQHNAANL